MTGWDLAGPEAAFPDPLTHAEAFEAARAEGLRITIARRGMGRRGAGPARARRQPGADRTRPGRRDDPELCEELIARGVTLDLCPTSNWQAGIVSSVAEHPLARLHRAGVPVTLNTDDTTVSDITLSEEYLHAIEAIGLTLPELWAINRRALTRWRLRRRERTCAAAQRIRCLGRRHPRAWGIPCYLQRVNCPSCGTPTEPGHKFCGECGARLTSVCPACGTTNAPSARFCGDCGTRLTAEGTTPTGVPRTAPAIPGAMPTPVAERRLVTVLFADLVGFTTLAEGRDSEAVRELLSRYFELARDVIERYGGTVEKFIGDAVMAVWGAPVAHEDDAERARPRRARACRRGPMPCGPQIQARAGVLTGEAAVTLGARDQGMVAGDLVNTASRLQSVAAPGTVLVGETTHRAASGSIAFERAG